MTSPFERALGEELLAAAYRDQRRRRRNRRAAIGGTIAAIIASATAALIPNPAAADVEITIANERVEVRITTEQATPDELVKAFRDEGLEVRVDELPSGPANVGRFVGVEIDGPDSGNVDRGNESPYSFDTFVVPEHWQGTLIVRLGRAAEDGEPYEVFSDVFAEDEPLHCTGVFGGSLATVADELEDYDVRVQAVGDGLPPDFIPLDEALRSPYGAWFVTRGDALSATDLALQVSPVAPPEEDGC